MLRISAKVVLEKAGEDLDRSCEKWGCIVYRFIVLEKYEEVRLEIRVKQRMHLKVMIRRVSLNKICVDYSL